MLMNTYFRVFFPKKGKLYREVYWGKSEADFLKRPHCSSDRKKERKMGEFMTPARGDAQNVALLRVASWNG